MPWSITRPSARTASTGARARTPGPARRRRAASRRSRGQPRRAARGLPGAGDGAPPPRPPGGTARRPSTPSARALPVAQTYGETWTSPLFVLACSFIQAAAMRGFDLPQEGFEKGWSNEDFGAATCDDGLRRLAEGGAAPYPMLTFAVSAIEGTSPDLPGNAGFFAQPGPEGAPNGLAVWIRGAPRAPGRGEHGGGQGPRQVRRVPRGLPDHHRHGGRERPDDGGRLRAARRRAARGRGHAPLLRGGRAHRPRARVPVAHQGPGARRDHRRGGLGHPPRRRGDRALRRDVQKQARQLGIEGW